MALLTLPLPCQLLSLPVVRSDCLLFSLTASCSVWLPSVQSVRLLFSLTASCSVSLLFSLTACCFSSNCSKAVIQLQRNKKPKFTTVLILMNCQHVCPSYLYFILSKVLLGQGDGSVRKSTCWQIWDPEFDPGDHPVEGEKQLLQNVPWPPHMYCGTLGAPIPK